MPRTIFCHIHRDVFVSVFDVIYNFLHTFWDNKESWIPSLLNTKTIELVSWGGIGEITTKLKLWSHHRFSDHDAIPFSSGVNKASDCMIAAQNTNRMDAVLGIQSGIMVDANEIKTAFDVLSFLFGKPWQLRSKIFTHFSRVVSKY